MHELHLVCSCECTTLEKGSLGLCAEHQWAKRPKFEKAFQFIEQSSSCPYHSYSRVLSSLSFFICNVSVIAGERVENVFHFQSCVSFVCIVCRFCVEIVFVFVYLS